MRPRSFVETPPQLSRQAAYSDASIGNAQNAPGAGRTAADVPANNPKQRPGNPIGTTTQGSSRRPFSVKG